MSIEELEKLHRSTPKEAVKYIVHGSWTGLAQGHTHNCYGFAKRCDAVSYARQLNKQNGWENDKSKYIVTAIERGSWQ